MKRISILGVYEWLILLVMLLIVLHAPISVSFGQLFPEQATLIKAWKEIVVAFAAVLALLLVHRRKLWRLLLSEWPIRLSAAFLAIHLLLATLLGGQLSAVAAGLLIDLRFIGFFVLVYILVLIKPSSTRPLLTAVAAGAAIVLGFGLLQITLLPDDALRSIGYSSSTITPYTTIDSNPEYVRINSTLRGPNPLGALSVVYAALAVSYVLIRRKTVNSNRRIAAASAAASSVAVLFASYARSAYLALVIAMGIIVASTITVSKRIAV